MNVPSAQPRRPWPLWLRCLAGLFGAACVLVGLLGVVLPVLPGIPFLVLGYVLLVPEFPTLAVPAVRAMRRWPSFRKLVPRRYRRRPPQARPPR